MSMLKPLAFSVALAFGAGPALAADGPGLGQPISEADVARWDISIQPDGTGLPPGSGTPAQGAHSFAQKCVMGHGEGAKGGTYAGLVGGAPVSSAIPEFGRHWGESA